MKNKKYIDLLKELQKYDKLNFEIIREVKLKIRNKK
jgi:hypothetical protein